jgi:hypothetical protein
MSETVSPNTVLGHYPIARNLGLGRAATFQGDAAKARKAYEGFFALWKDADGGYSGPN